MVVTDGALPPRTNMYTKNSVSLVPVRDCQLAVSGTMLTYFVDIAAVGKKVVEFYKQRAEVISPLVRAIKL
jgi:hypothetical protein